MNAEWRRHGARGSTILFAEYHADGTALLETKAGPAPLTVADVRAQLKAQGWTIA